MPMTKHIPIALALLAPAFATAAISAACSSEPAGSFDLAITIEGPGRIGSGSGLVDCTGPKDCGTIRVSSGTIRLLAEGVSAAPFEVSWALDGVDEGKQSTFLDVTGAAGEQHVARARFTAIPGVPGEKADAGPDQDAGKKPDGGAEALPSCYGKMCSSKQVCCADFTAQTTGCAAACPSPAARMDCQRADDCLAGKACVPRMNGSETVYACATAPTGREGQLCDGAHPCAGGGPCLEVIQSASVSSCVAGGLVAGGLAK